MDRLREKESEHDSAQLLVFEFGRWDAVVDLCDPAQGSGHYRRPSQRTFYLRAQLMVSKMPGQVNVSVVVPVFNEQGNIVPLYDKIASSLGGCRFIGEYEILI